MRSAYGEDGRSLPAWASCCVAGGFVAKDRAELLAIGAEPLAPMGRPYKKSVARKKS